MKILEKNLLILASAGSGKTFQLGNRVIGLVARGEAPERIVALTFTRKAAGEFADSVLTKLAGAASDSAAAEDLRKAIAMPSADFAECLERVVRALPRLTFGTMDGFFAKIVRGFQYELGLTGGKFDLLEGARAAAAKDEIQAEILGGSLQAGAGEEFMHAFRRATFGKELQGVQENLRSFITQWQERYQESSSLEWGPSKLAGVEPGAWERHKHELGASVLRGLPAIEYTRKGQQDAMGKMVNRLLEHRVGSGSLGETGSLLDSAIDNCAKSGNGPLILKFHKEFMLAGPSADALRKMLLLAARCEFSAALLRTRSIRDVVSVYDALCEKKLRRRGLLGFNDVKLIMGQWVNHEDARVRRDSVDFRLGARYEHWLLDEFQDTSRADWMGLQPLIDEAADADAGSVFVVGDRKQAIYAWRGGDVTLFDELIDRYQVHGIKTAPLTESWRSCPEVLTLVNQVCGDKQRLRELFGAVADRWIWETHDSAAPLTKFEKRGESLVEVVEGKWPERLERVSTLLTELGVGERELSCGILVRTNAEVREVSDTLRAKGFDVIEDGRRKPAEDHPVGIALAHLLKWLAVPADTFAWEIVQMSPLKPALATRFGEAWQKIWESLLAIAAERGFSAMIEEVVELCWDDWSDFGRRRAGDIIMALAALDAQGGVTIREAADWVKRMELSQNPGAAAVQVMTVHKSKGLGFDVVILPDIPTDSVPAMKHFEVAEGEDWLSQVPPKWARALLPELWQPEEHWSNAQSYENFCTLYVALTRAKRGLYVLLEPPPKTQDLEKPSLCNWLASAIGSPTEPGIAHQNGTRDWVESVRLSTRPTELKTEIFLGESAARRERVTPSGAKKQNQDPTQATASIVHSPHGMIFGTEVHAAFERVGWIDEEEPKLPYSEAGRLVTELLNNTKLRDLFTRANRTIDLFREQAVDATLDEKWLSGVIDRLHLHRDSDGVVVAVELIDFKTDAVEDLQVLATRYSGQMKAYRAALELAYPSSRISCILLSTRLQDFLRL
jgi:ATP-dependent exoDNAse (exonuclease V) beta subunit